jgi:dipeptidyl-peptidase-4
MEAPMSDSYPRQHARTRGFNLGLPRAFTVAEDGSRVAFLRTPAGDDPVASLWVYDTADGERVAFDPAQAGGEDGITPQERDRRERAGEKQTGVVAYATDPALTMAAFVVGQRLMLADLMEGGARELTPSAPPFDPRPDPTGRRVAYVADGSLHVIDLETDADVELAADPDPDVHWGLTEFIAAEEMGRSRGYWWAPDGERLIACRVDERSVSVWHIASPVDPAAPPRAVRYPQAGTANAEVTLHVVGVDGSRVDVQWDRDAFEYVAAVTWTDEGPPLVLVQSRDQRDVQVLGIDPDSGATQRLWHDHDDVWIDLVPGVPAWLPGGRLLTAGHRDDTRTLLIDGEPATPATLQVDGVISAGEDVIFRATDDPTEMHVWRSLADGTLTRVSERTGVHAAAAGGDLTVLVSETMDEVLPGAVAFRAGHPIHTFERRAETPELTAKPTFAILGQRGLRAAILTPGGNEPEAPLPVLMDPYGGPQFSRVTRAGRSLLESQWLADQGFVVIVADGRGTPNRGVAWDQSVHRDLADPAMEDQVEALHAAAELYPFLDLSKVAIRGWSFGGYLTCLALLRRPDVFHAGIAGAPCTDMRFYDTHYTERYLGMPQDDPDAYERADVVKDAANLRGELLLIHGIADDNVYVTHSLRMSKALMENGRRHSMIPLSGITHRPTDEVAAANMLKIQVEFLHRALGVPKQD